MAVSLFVFAFAGAVAAQEGLSGVNIKPAIIEDKVSPGDVYSSELSVTNLDSVEKTFYLVKRDIARLDEQGLPVFAQAGEKTGHEVSEWVKVEADSVTIASQETKKIPFTVTVPQDAGPGGHYGGIFVATTPLKPEGTGIGVGFQVGTIINLRVAGDIVEDAIIREFYADKSIYNEASVLFTVTIENKGNTVIRPRGPLEITNIFGKKVGVVVINEKAGAVLPKSERSFQVSWVSDDGFAFGKYQAVAGVIYGDEQRNTLTGVTSFWVIPLGIILPAGIGLLLVITVLYVLMRVQIKRKVNEMVKQSGGNTAGQSSPDVAATASQHVPISKLTITAVVSLICALLFLVVLFFMFA
jgi:hypothetical protein